MWLTGSLRDHGKFLPALNVEAAHLHYRRPFLPGNSKRRPTRVAV
jgi:hypothetical protein